MGHRNDFGRRSVRMCNNRSCRIHRHQIYNVHKSSTYWIAKWFCDHVFFPNFGNTRHKIAEWVFILHVRTKFVRGSLFSMCFTGNQCRWPYFWQNGHLCYSRSRAKHTHCSRKFFAHQIPIQSLFSFESFLLCHTRHSIDKWHSIDMLYNILLFSSDYYPQRTYSCWNI